MVSKWDVKVAENCETTIIASEPFAEVELLHTDNVNVRRVKTRNIQAGEVIAYASSRKGRGMVFAIGLSKQALAISSSLAMMEEPSLTTKQLTQSVAFGHKERAR